jgi:hypothetical protein
MVRVVRLSWTDDGPLQAGDSGRDWFGEGEIDGEEPPPDRHGGRRRRRSKSSPIDGRSSPNAPADPPER